MGKKNKKDKQGKGKQKTDIKTEKNAAKRAKKELAAKGEVSYRLLPSPRFLCRPTTLYIIARAVERQSAIYTENS